MKGAIQSQSKSDGTIIFIKLLLIFGICIKFTTEDIQSPDQGPSTTIIQTSVTTCPSNAVRQNGICQCLEGYLRSGSICTDIDECSNPSNNNCHGNADCKNVDGSYNCSCKSGYVGNGFHCIEINECEDPGWNKCDLNAKCSNTLGSYKCTCKTGYTGDGTDCSDINECNTNPCAHICTNTKGSYKCSCKTGYRVSNTIQCIDINECNENTHNCDVNAKCSNTEGGFNCSCETTGFFGYKGNGTYCQEDRLLPFLTNTEQLSSGIDSCRRKKLYVPIPIENRERKFFYICENGLISIGKRQRHPFSELMPRHRILAAFWSDFDVRYRKDKISNKVYYQYYAKDDSNPSTSAVLTKANKIMTRYFTSTGSESIDVTAALVATWYKVQPHGISEFHQSDQTSTFQVAVLTNQEKTYLLLSYEDKDMRLKGDWRKTFAGYQTSEEKSLILFDEDPFPYDILMGNFGLTGLRVYKIADLKTTSTAAACMRWYNQMPSTFLITALVHQRRYDCPPSESQVKADRLFFRIRSQNFFLNCYRKFLIGKINSRIVITECCYTNIIFSLITGFDPSFSQPRTTLHISKTISPFRRYELTSYVLQTVANTKQAYHDCCIKENLYDLYFEKRPVLIGDYYRPPRRAMCYGDPHILTLDGKGYTFNGLGDYVLLKSMTNETNITCHARTAKAPTPGQPSQATVFSAFAFLEKDSVKVEIYLNMTDTTTSIIVDGNVWPPSQNVTEEEKLGVSISYKAGVNISTFSLLFSSGLSADVEITKGGLAISFTIADEFFNVTEGLLGRVNGDMTDDFLTPDGTILHINSTEEEIYNNFGQKWQVSVNQSLFSVRVVHESFTPTFFKSVDDLFGNGDKKLKDEAIRLCGLNNKACLFDAFATKDLTLAATTANQENTFNEQKLILNSFPPNITGPSVLVVDYGKVYTFQITAFSNSSSSILRYDVIANGTKVTVNKTTGVFSFNVTNYQNISLEYVVTDNSSSLSRTMTPELKICYCLNGGICDKTQKNELSDLNSPFLNTFACNCTLMYEGSFCQNFVNPCDTSPCYVNNTCTLDMKNGNFSCGPCPESLTGDGEKCYDIDECITMQPCQHICTNYRGGFNCSCNTGYTALNSTHCKDNNECSSPTKSSCHQNATCNNTPGSYTCSCNSGFTGNGHNCTDINECSDSPCQQNCTNTPGSYFCSCRTGYRLNNSMCHDVDECQENNPCHIGVSQCFNTPGSYLCTCNKGYSGDGKTCLKIITSSAVEDLSVTQGLTGAISTPELQLTTFQTWISTEVNTTILSTTSTREASSFIPTILITASSIASNQLMRTSIPEISSSRTSMLQSASSAVQSYSSSSAQAADSTSTTIIPSPSLATTSYAATTSVISGPCTKNICQNGGTCTTVNGVDICQCTSYFFGKTCTEGRKLIEASASFTDLTIDGTIVNLNDNELEVEGSSLNTRIKNALKILLLNYIQSLVPEAEDVIINKIRKGSVIATYTVVLSNNYTKSISEFSNTIQNPSSANLRTNQVIGNVAPNSIKGNDLNECNSSPCHSNANCKNIDFGFTCTCKSGYKGNGFSCDEESDKSTITIAVSVVGALVILLIILLAVVRGLKHKREYSTRRSETLHQEDQLNWDFLNARFRASRRSQSNY